VSDPRAEERTRRRTIVKVCGLTRLEDATWAIECGADWLGFIVAAGGPRDIGPDGMAAILADLPGAVSVAIVANLGPDEALAVARRAGASRLQLHRVDPAGWPADFPLPCAFVTSVDAGGAARGALAPPPHLVQLDTAHATLLGGTGMTFPWKQARTLCGGRPFMLAGGLDGDNVAAAIAAASPFGVDAASRLESVPGIKDRDKVRRFVAAVREFDERATDPA
jgi:phosphoribosylanthranilate isomerase